MDKTKEAKKILIHYFKTAFRFNCIPWADDNEAEIEAAVDYIIEAAAEKARKYVDFQLLTSYKRSDKNVLRK